jgi:hypothetical protein
MDKKNIVYLQNGVFSTIKKNKIMSYVVKWMELEIVMLSKVSQSQTNITCFLSLEESRSEKRR